MADLTPVDGIFSAKFNQTPGFDLTSLGGPYDNVLAWGAVPGDTSDDWTALHNAVRDAYRGGGGVVLLPGTTGRYTLASPLLIPAGVRLMGVGKNGTRVKYTGTDAAIRIMSRDLYSCISVVNSLKLSFNNTLKEIDDDTLNGKTYWTDLRVITADATDQSSAITLANVIRTAIGYLQGSPLEYLNTSLLYKLNNDTATGCAKDWGGVLKTGGGVDRAPIMFEASDCSNEAGARSILNTLKTRMNLLLQKLDLDAGVQSITYVATCPITSGTATDSSSSYTLANELKSDFNALLAKLDADTGVLASGLASNKTLQVVSPNATTDPMVTTLTNELNKNFVALLPLLSGDFRVNDPDYHINGGVERAQATDLDTLAELTRHMSDKLYYIQQKLDADVAVRDVDFATRIASGMRFIPQFITPEIKYTEYYTSTSEPRKIEHIVALANELRNGHNELCNLMGDPNHGAHDTNYSSLYRVMKLDIAANLSDNISLLNTLSTNFNLMLSQLDLDVGVAGTTYSSTYRVTTSPASDLATAIALANAIKVRFHTATTLLSTLDADSGVNDTDYNSTLDVGTANASDLATCTALANAIKIKFHALLAKLDSDIQVASSIYLETFGVLPSTTFSVINDTYPLLNLIKLNHNAVCTKLNNDAGVTAADWYTTRGVTTADASSQATAWALANAIKARYLATSSIISKLDGDAQVFSTDFVTMCQVTSADATSDATAYTLTNELVTKFNAMVWKLSHDGPGWTDYNTSTYRTSVAVCTDVSTAKDLANDLKAKHNTLMARLSADPAFLDKDYASYLTVTSADAPSGGTTEEKVAALTPLLNELKFKHDRAYQKIQCDIGVTNVKASQMSPDIGPRNSEVGISDMTIECTGTGAKGIDIINCSNIVLKNLEIYLNGDTQTGIQADAANHSSYYWRGIYTSWFEDIYIHGPLNVSDGNYRKGTGIKTLGLFDAAKQDWDGGFNANTMRHIRFESLDTGLFLGPGYGNNFFGLKFQNIKTNMLVFDSRVNKCFFYAPYFENGPYTAGSPGFCTPFTFGTGCTNNVLLHVVFCAPRYTNPEVLYSDPDSLSTDTSTMWKIPAKLSSNRITASPKWVYQTNAPRQTANEEDLCVYIGQDESGLIPNETVMDGIFRLNMADDSQSVAKLIQTFSTSLVANGINIQKSATYNVTSDVAPLFNNSISLRRATRLKADGSTYGPGKLILKEYGVEGGSYEDAGPGDNSGAYSLALALKASFNMMLAKLDADLGVNDQSYLSLRAVTSPGSAADLVKSYTLANEVKSKFNSTLSQLDSDGGVTGVDYYSGLNVSQADAGTLSTLITMVNLLKSSINLLLEKLDNDGGGGGVADKTYSNICGLNPRLANEIKKVFSRRLTTSNNTTTDLFVYNSLDVSTTANVRVVLTANQSKVTSPAYGSWVKMATVYRGSSGNAFFRGVESDVFIRTSGGLVASLVASGSGFKVQVTGVSGGLVVWSAQVTVVESKE